MVHSLADILNRGFPGRQWTFAKDYTTLQFLDGGASITLAQLQDMDTQLSAIDAATKYQKDRALAYDTIGNQLDMLWHSMDSNEIPKSAAFYNSIKAVKDKYPK